ncbi:MAG: hypothetical protein ABL902_01310 [Gallionella sp.]|nr:hypothetical protein [Gallionella sp.]
MAKPNYTFEKRQKEIAKKQKKEAKLLKKSTPVSEQEVESSNLQQSAIIEAGHS